VVWSFLILNSRVTTINAVISGELDENSW